MPTAVRVKVPGTPGELAKNRSRVAYRGGEGRPPCRSCGKPAGTPFIVTSKLPERLATGLQGQAFSAGVKPLKGMVMVGVLASWPNAWNTGRGGHAQGRPQGDVDSPVSGVLDALAGILYGDDAQVAVLVAVNAKAAKGQERIEVSVVPLSPRLLEDLQRELGLPFTSATLSTGQQVTI